MELEWAEMDKPRRKKAQVKGLDLYPLYGRTKTCVPIGLVKLAYPPSAVIDGAVGLPMSILMRIM